MSIPNLMVARLAKFDISNIMYVVYDQGAAEITQNHPCHTLRDGTTAMITLHPLPCHDLAYSPNIASRLKLHAIQ